MLTPGEQLLIKKTFLFSKVQDEELNQFLCSENCSVCDFSKGEALLKSEGEKHIGILLSGKAAALCDDQSKSSLKTFSAGELFGAADVFCKDETQPISKMKAVSSCRVLFITKKGLEKFICSNPQRALDYIGFLSNRVAFLNSRISTFTAGEALSRVAKYLYEAADSSGICHNINFSQLAKSLDISRASLYRAKDQLVKNKAIAVDKKDVKILNRQALKNIF